MVGTANRYNGQALKAQQSLEASLKRVKTERATVAEFLAAYDKLQTQYKHAYAKFMAVGAPDEDRHFFDAVEARLEGLAARMKSTTVPYARKGNQAMVKTRINDMGEAHLLLDTGASLVTLSEIAARRLGVSLSGERTVTLTLANGSTVTAEPVVLASVQVGEARVENVPAAVLDSEDAGEMDGLLGMSFLQAFRVHINGADGGLELERFE
jgi:clan AA aspartic protease (TIGR02281 family)